MPDDFPPERGSRPGVYGLASVADLRAFAETLSERVYGLTKTLEEDHETRDSHEARLAALEQWHLETKAATAYEDTARKKRDASLDFTLKIMQAVPAVVTILAAAWWIVHLATVTPPPVLSH